MKVKATISFAGEISMFPGEVRDIPEGVAAPLLACGYLTALDEGGTSAVGHLDAADLKKMKRADLNALAADMGIENPAEYKSAAALAAAIADLEVTTESEE